MKNILNTIIKQQEKTQESIGKTIKSVTLIWYFILFFNWRILIVKFNNSLTKILKIYPYIPYTGTIKNIIEIVVNKSKILQNITLTCSLIPFNILSIILSI